MLANYLTSFGGYQTAVWDGKGRGTLEFKVQSSGVQGIEFRVQSSGFRVQGIVISWFLNS